MLAGAEGGRECPNVSTTNYVKIEENTPPTCGDMIAGAEGDIECPNVSTIT